MSAVERGRCAGAAAQHRGEDGERSATVAVKGGVALSKRDLFKSMRRLYEELGIAEDGSGIYLTRPPPQRKRRGKAAEV